MCINKKYYIYIELLFNFKLLIVIAILDMYGFKSRLNKIQSKII